MKDGEVQFPIDDRILLLYSGVLLENHIIKIVFFIILFNKFLN